MKGGETTNCISDGKFSEVELSRIFYLVRSELPTLYVLPFYMSTYQVYKHGYLVSTSIFMLLYIFISDWPLISFFAPLIPLFFIEMFSFVESGSITLKITKVHGYLIMENIQIKWDELMDVVMVVIWERHFFKDDNKDDNELNSI